MVAAASEALPEFVRMRRQDNDACKARANCLKPKEISLTARHFDLPCEPNCLKVKTIARTDVRAAAKHVGQERWQA